MLSDCCAVPRFVRNVESAAAASCVPCRPVGASSGQQASGHGLVSTSASNRGRWTSWHRPGRHYEDGGGAALGGSPPFAVIRGYGTIVAYR
jgi:hypothetical protein